MALDKGSGIDKMHLYLMKTYSRVPHRRLNERVKSYCQDENMLMDLRFPNKEKTNGVVIKCER